MKQRAGTGLRGDLGDAGAHRPGAEHTDRPGPGHGISALIPVAARPMMSFWICDVPS